MMSFVPRATWRMYPFWRAQLIGMFSIFGIVAVVMLVSVTSSSHPGRSTPPPYFVAFWIFALLWNAYWFLVRISYRVDVADGLVEWRTPVRSGSFSLADLLAIRPARFGGGVHVFESSDGDKILVIATAGFVDFVGTVRQMSPHTTVKLSRRARITNRFPGWGWRGYKPPKPPGM